MNTGRLPSHKIFPAKFDEILAVGTGVTVITMGEDKVVQLLLLVTSTVMLSPVTRSVRDRVFELEIGPKLVPFLKNSYCIPPVAVKLTCSPTHEVLEPVNEATGAGLTDIFTALLINSHCFPLKVEITLRRKSVVVTTPEGVKVWFVAERISTKALVPVRLCH